MMHDDTTVKREHDFIVEQASPAEARYHLWGDRIRAYIKHCREDPTIWARWRHCYALAHSRHWSFDEVDDDDLSNSDRLSDRISVPKISIAVENLVGFFTRNNPKFVGRIRRREDLAARKAQEDYLHYTWREQNFGATLRACIRDWLTCGNMIARVDWYSRDEAEDERNAHEGRRTEAYRIDYTDTRQSDTAVSRRVSPFQFLVDLTARDGTLNTARWCGEIIYRPYQDVVLDKRYDREVISQLRSGEIKTVSVKNFRTTIGDDFSDQKDHQRALEADCESIVLVEIWDKRSKQRLIFLYGHWDKPLREEDWPYEYLDGFPYVFSKFIPETDRFFGYSFVFLAARLQLVLNRAMSRLSAYVRRFNPKYKGTDLDDALIRTFVSDETGSVLNLTGTQDIEPVQTPQLPEDLWRTISTAQNMLRELMGQDQLSGGGPLPARTTAREIDSREGFFGLRHEDKSVLVDEFVLEVGRILLKHVKANLNKPQAIYVVGRAGEAWRDVTPKAIQRSIDFELLSTSREQADPIRDQQQAIQFLQTLPGVVGQIIQVQGLMQQTGGQSEPLQVDLAEALRLVLEKLDFIDLERVMPGLNPEDPLPAQDGSELFAAPPAQPPAPPQDPDQSLGRQGQATDLLNASMGNIPGVAS